MNKIVNKFFLEGDKFLPVVHLRQPGSTYIPCGLFTRNKERIQNFKETGDSRYIYQNKLDKVCLQHVIPYGDFKYLAGGTAPDKILSDQAFNVAKYPKCDGYQRVLPFIGL